MDDLIRAFIDPAGAWGGKGLDDREPPDLRTAASARLVALLVEALGGTFTVTRSDLHALADDALLVILEGEDMLQLETRRVWKEPSASE